MILRLRKRHRACFTVLAVALPAAFAAGILSRPAPLPIADLVPLRQNPAAAFTHRLFESEDLWPAFEIATRILADAVPPSQLAAELQPAQALPLPEVLAYWREDGPAHEPGSLEDAFLLGTLAGTQPRRWLLPQGAQLGDGHLILYSLPHQKIIAQAGLPLRRIIREQEKP